MPEGICRLTRKHGKFVRSHLIPQALTRPNVQGNYFIQGEPHDRPKKMNSSWYDEALVTRAGEDILARHDMWGIAELRRLKLVWSSWKNRSSLPTNDLVSKSTFFGVRDLQCRNAARFRLFFLSLLWRAAATERPEFAGVQLSVKELETLGRMIREDDPKPLTFYPTTLLQLTEKGPTHNFPPIAIDENVVIGNGEVWRDYCFRFYFDGLVARMHRPTSKKDSATFTHNFTVGFDDRLVVQTRATEDSWQIENLAKASIESALQWPKTHQRLTKQSFDYDAAREIYRKKHPAPDGVDPWWITPKE